MNTDEQPTVFLSEWQALNAECEQLRESLRACQRDAAPWIERALEAERLLLAAVREIDRAAPDCRICGEYAFIEGGAHGDHCPYPDARHYLADHGLLKEPA